jgi:hypothetical protein
VKIPERLEKRMFYKVPILFKEGRAKTIWSRAGVTVHRKNSSPQLIHRERLDKSGCLKRVKRGRGDKGG